MLTTQDKLYLTLNKNMSHEDLRKTIETASDYIKNLNDERKINPLVADVVQKSLCYARQTFCSSNTITAVFSRAVVNDNRYERVNDIFNAGVKSTLSLEHEKSFFRIVQERLMRIIEKKSDLRDECLSLVLTHENRFIKELEDNEPLHRDAVNGIVSASFLMGFISIFLLRSPWLFIVSCLSATLKFVPAANDHSSPSILGQIVYNENAVRNAGKRIHDALPVNLSYRLLSIFKKGSNLGLNAIERTVTTVERIVDHQHDARRFLVDNGHVAGINIEDVTSSSEEDNSYAARQARSQQMSMR